MPGMQGGMVSTTLPAIAVAPNATSAVSAPAQLVPSATALPVSTPSDVKPCCIHCMNNPTAIQNILAMHGILKRPKARHHKKKTKKSARKHKHRRHKHSSSSDSDSDSETSQDSEQETNTDAQKPNNTEQPEAPQSSSVPPAPSSVAPSTTTASTPVGLVNPSSQGFVNIPPPTPLTHAHPMNMTVSALQFYSFLHSEIGITDSFLFV